MMLKAVASISERSTIQVQIQNRIQVRCQATVRKCVANSLVVVTNLKLLTSLQFLKIFGLSGQMAETKHSMFDRLTKKSNGL